jgi:hypothetical protein
MTEIKAPNKLPKTVFLAGSIETGEAENWQEMVARRLFRAVRNCVYG